MHGETVKNNSIASITSIWHQTTLTWHDN